MGTGSDGSDATIVWVRRRNGSWWPGRVLRPEDVADSHVPSKSGKPVKLLGRNDASVDWYNLEKSKRVKPFRCGQFDACIERAEASHSSPIKKREKYARREDAILHALELEKQQLEMQQESTALSCHAANKTLGLVERDSNRNRFCKTNISEDDTHEIASHVVVEDASPEIVKSKGKLFRGNSDITEVDHSDLIPHGGQNSGFISQSVIDKKVSVFKRKTFLPSAVSDNPAKRRDRRRPLVKVLQNSTKLSASYSFQPHHDPSGNPMPAEGHLISIANDSQKITPIHPSPDADDPLDYSSYSWKHAEADSGNACQLQQSGYMSNESSSSGWTEENDFDSSATDSELEMVEEKLRSGINQPLKQTVESSIESGMSLWHLKGKRNSRTTVLKKRLHECVDGKSLDGTYKSNAQFRETCPERKAATPYNIAKFDSATTPNALGPKYSSEKEIGYDSEDEEIITRFGNKRDYLEGQHSDYVDSDDDDGQLISEPGWGAMKPFQIWKAYWEHPEDNLDQFYTPFSYRLIPMLIDVDLKVQARYQGEYVPLVSLMSKLNGMAIVGHPVHIEVLEDGSTDLLLPSNDFGDTAVAPIWKIAKRTSMLRIPRSNPYLPNNNSCLDGKSQLDLPNLQAKRKRLYHAHRSASGRFQRKPFKTVCLSSSQKTRALSSFVSEKKHDGGGVFSIKAGESMPLVTCIPTKVVFSRILESVARPPMEASATERG